MAFLWFFGSAAGAGFTSVGFFKRLWRCIRFLCVCICFFRRCSRFQLFLRFLRLLPVRVLPQLAFSSGFGDVSGFLLFASALSGDETAFGFSSGFFGSGLPVRILPRSASQVVWWCVRFLCVCICLFRKRSCFWLFLRFFGSDAGAGVYLGRLLKRLRRCVRFLSVCIRFFRRRCRFRLFLWFLRIPVLVQVLPRLASRELSAARLAFTVCRFIRCLFGRFALLPISLSGSSFPGGVPSPLLRKRNSFASFSAHVVDKRGNFRFLCKFACLCGGGCQRRSETRRPRAGAG